MSNDSLVFSHSTKVGEDQISSASCGNLEAPARRVTRVSERVSEQVQQLFKGARLQTNILELHLQCCDLSMLLQEAVPTQKRLAPERTIVLENTAPEHVVPIIASPERITQVITTYLGHTLSSSPADQPVTVQLTVEDAGARVSVQDEGPGIPVEEQGHIWGRFYRAKGIAVQHELDLSLGLGYI